MDLEAVRLGTLLSWTKELRWNKARAVARPGTSSGGTRPGRLPALALAPTLAGGLRCGFQFEHLFERKRKVMVCVQEFAACENQPHVPRGTGISQIVLF